MLNIKLDEKYLIKEFYNESVDIETYAQKTMTLKKLLEECGLNDLSVNRYSTVLLESK